MKLYKKMCRPYIKLLSCKEYKEEIILLDENWYPERKEEELREKYSDLKVLKFNNPWAKLEFEYKFVELSEEENCYG